MVNGFDQDFIIIGSGPAGISAAIPLVANGKKVLLIDAGADSDSIATRSRWQKILGSNLEGLHSQKNLSPKMHTPNAISINQKFSKLTKIDFGNFAAFGSYQRGGLSNIWGSCLQKLNREDIADWPIDYNELSLNYNEILKKMGVSITGNQNREELRSLYGDMNWSQIGAASNKILNRYLDNKEKYENYTISPAINGILIENRTNRQACNYCGGCLYGCDRKSIYNTVFDLDSLKRYQNFKIINNKIVEALSKDSSGNWSIKLSDNSEIVATKIILAAGVFGTASILRTFPELFQNGIKLYNNPVMAIPMLTLGRLEHDKNDTHSLAQLIHELRFGSGNDDIVTGAIYELQKLPYSFMINKMPFGRVASRIILSKIIRRIVVATCYFPGKFTENKLTIQTIGNEKKLKLSSYYSVEFIEIADRVKRLINQNLRKLELLKLSEFEMAPIGSDVHYAGTFSMGGANTNNTSSLGELNGLRDIYIVDGSILPSLPSKFITLTIMANAYRIGKELAAL